MLSRSAQEQKIVIFMPKFLGDCVNCTPSFELLRQYYPNCQLYLVISEPLQSLFKTEANIHIVTDGRVKGSKFSESRTLIKKLKELNADACILMTNKFVDAVVSRLAKIPVIVGYNTEIRGKLLTHSLPMDRARHYINRYAYLANLACHNHFEKLPDVSLKVDKELSEIKANAVNIGFSILSPAKMSRHIPVSKTIEVISALQQKLSELNIDNVQFYMLGSTNEALAAQQVSEGCKSIGINQIKSLAGSRNIPELISDIASLNLLITADSGPLHIAAATKTKTLAIHTKGTSAFSMVCPKGKHIKVVSSAGSFINDNDQVLDVSNEELVTTALSFFNSAES